MSFINLAKSGFSNVTNHGKLIGTAKNSGIKVYERIEADGKRILTSFDKEGNNLKQVKRKFPTPHEMFTTTVNYKTGVETSSKTTLLPVDSRVYYEFTKTTPVEGHSLKNIDIFNLSKKSDSFTNKPSLKEVRKTKVETFKDKSNIDYVSVSQITPEQTDLRFSSYPRINEAMLESSGHYKMNDGLTLKKGTSIYDSTNDVLSHSRNDNPHELNIAQALYDGLKHIWTK